VNVVFKNKHQLISLSIILLFGIGLFYVGTDGFTAFTEETARTNKLIEGQPLLPKVTLEDNLEREYDFSEFEGKYVFMTFFYTSCSTVCPILEMNVSEVYDQIPEELLGEDIVFLSVSFDPERDTPEVLDRYRTYFNTDSENWRMARVKDEDELATLLDEFGVIAIPDGEGEFAHNVAFYLVNRDGYLIDVMEYDDVETATDKVLSVLEG
jgi:protein SCO1/2